MKLSTFTTLSACLGTSAAASLAPANYAVVINECTVPIYAQSVPFDETIEPGPLTKVEPGARFQEDMRDANSTIKLATDSDLTWPLFFDYSSTPDPMYSYYSFNTKFGNPFANQHNILNPGKGCQGFDCQPNDANCYSTADDKKVYNCPKPLTIFAKLCA